MALINILITILFICDIKTVFGKQPRLYEQPWHNELFGDGEFNEEVR